MRTLIQRTATACPTCHFCHVQCKDWREHIMKCTVSYQCAVVCLAFQDGCRSGAGSVLRGCEAGGQCTQAKATTGGSQGDSRLSSRSVSGAAPPRVVFSHFFGKAACIAGRGDQGATPGPRTDLLHEARGAQHVVPPIPYGTTVSEEASRKSRMEARPATSQGAEPGVRLDRACQAEDFSQKVKDLGWRDPAVGWRFQYWNPAVRHLEEDKSRKPLTGQEVAGHLQKLTQLLLLPDLVHRFSCTKRLTETTEGTATFKLDLSIRTPQSLEVWSSLLALQGCTVLQLGGIEYKREGFKPSPAIAKIIKEMIRGR